MRHLFTTPLIGWLALAPLVAADPPPAHSPLFEAVRAGDSVAVRAQLTSGADVNARDEGGNTPLMVAAFCADADMLRLLLRAGADVKATNRAGATALMRGVTFRDKARLLVDAGADVGVPSAIGNTALLLAARQQGNVGTVKLLLDRGAAVNATNAFGASALMAAAAAEDLESTRLLLDRGAAVNAMPAMSPDGFLWGGGRTALGWAAFRGNEALLKLLLGRGARPEVPAIGGSALAQAAWGGHAGAARLLLAAGVPVDQRDPMANYTPLHWAASSERLDPALVQLLLQHGAEVNAEGGQPVDGFLGATHTPLQLALKRGDTPIVQSLRRAGAREVAADGDRRSPKPVRAPAGTVDDAAIAAAIQRALPLLHHTATASADSFRRHRSRQACVSCHQQSLPLNAISLAGSRYFGVDPAVVRRTVDRTVEMALGEQELDLQALFHPEPAIGMGYLLMSLQMAGQGASGFTDSSVHHLTVLQEADGSWAWNLPRPPIQSSDIGATALAARALKHFPIPGRQQELSRRVARARQWLERVRPESNEERAYQLLGLAWTGERAAKLKPVADALVREQRADGGWAQLPKLESDAFATGQALFALLDSAQASANHPAVRRGVHFLLRTQLEDGAWHVRRRAFPFQPPMDSSFPHGADGWVSASASSWAVMALALAVDASKAPPPLLAYTGAGEAGTRSEAPMDLNGAGAVDFGRDIQPLFERSCVACHSGERPKGGFVLTDRTSLLQGGNRGEPALVVGQPEAGSLIHLVLDQVEDLEMPPVGKRSRFPALSGPEVARLRAWIREGATWPEGTILRASEK